MVAQHVARTRTGWPMCYLEEGRQVDLGKLAKLAALTDTTPPEPDAYSMPALLPPFRDSARLYSDTIHDTLPGQIQRHT